MSTAARKRLARTLRGGEQTACSRAAATASCAALCAAYSLVLHKTEALFSRELQARKRDETDLDWLAARWSPDA